MRARDIVDDLSIDIITANLKRVDSIVLPDDIDNLVKEYNYVFADNSRNDFIWRWLYDMFSIVYLPIIDDLHLDNLINAKVMLTMFIVIVDDVGEKIRDKRLLNSLINIPFYSNKEYDEYHALAYKVWSMLMSKVSKFPYFSKIKDVFYYDVRQVMNSILYSNLLNDNPYIMNERECWLYMPFNMASLAYSDLDIMCSRSLDIISNLGKIREFLLYAQIAARVGNWVSTWERELKEGDIANGVMVYSFINGILNMEEIKKIASRSISKEEEDCIVDRIKSSDVEDIILSKWDDAIDAIKDLGYDAIGREATLEFIDSIRKLFMLHISSRGYK